MTSMRCCKPARAFAGHSGVFLNATAAGSLVAIQSVKGMAWQRRNPACGLWRWRWMAHCPKPARRRSTKRGRRCGMRCRSGRKARLAPRNWRARCSGLREALNQRLQDMAQQAVKDGKLPRFDRNAQHFTAPSLDRLIKQMEQAAREGRTADAQQKLEELERMLDKLKNARVLSPQEAEQARQAQKAAPAAERRRAGYGEAGSRADG